MTDNESPTTFTWPRLFIAIGVVALLFIVIQVGATINGNDHGPTAEQECAIQAVIECDAR